MRLISIILSKGQTELLMPAFDELKMNDSEKPGAVFGQIILTTDGRNKSILQAKYFEHKAALAIQLAIGEQAPGCEIPAGATILGIESEDII